MASCTDEQVTELDAIVVVRKAKKRITPKVQICFQLLCGRAQTEEDEHT